MTKRAECLTSTILLIAAASIFLACPMLLAQNDPAPAAPSSTATDLSLGPSFDVATIKPHLSEARSSWYGIRPTPDGLKASSVSLQELVLSAYSHEFGDKVSGAPEWAKTAFFDVRAKMSEADIVEMQNLKSAEVNARRQRMEQALLAERFKLKVHVETGQAPIYELIVAKGGAKIEVAATDTSGKSKTGMMFRNGTSVARGIWMGSLATFLSLPNGGVGRPVIDKTGLTGTYNFTLHWSGCTSWPCGPEDAASMFSALQELGLKL